MNKLDNESEDSSKITQDPHIDKENDTKPIKKKKIIIQEFDDDDIALNKISLHKVNSNKDEHIINKDDKKYSNKIESTNDN